MSIYIYYSLVLEIKKIKSEVSVDVVAKRISDFGTSYNKDLDNTLFDLTLSEPRNTVGDYHPLNLQQTTWGLIEALSCLIECGANPKLIDEHWVLNHYKWIIWKIASMRNKLWTQSAIELMVEDDVSPPLTMVLCVSEIINDNITPSTTLSLSSTSSFHMMKLKLTDGCLKFVWVCGKHGGKAQALSVLNATSPVYLKLSGNSTKLAHWDSKFGFRKLEIFAMLKSLTSDGGSVPVIDVIIMQKQALITAWNPSSSLYDSIYEGQRNHIYSLLVANHQPYDSYLLSKNHYTLCLTSRGNTTIWKEPESNLNQIRNS
nr:15380_t:CDS:2 [Entrophospora candida]